MWRVFEKLGQLMTSSGTRAFRSRWWTAVLAAVLLGGVHPVPVAAAPVLPTMGKADEASAMERAQRTGQPVPIDTLTTETDEYVAQPDGTVHWRQYRRPVRVRQDGKWTPVDTTLVRRQDGTVGPKVATVALTLSGGGPGSAAKPLVTMAHDGAEVGLGWPASTPPRSASGASARSARTRPRAPSTGRRHLTERPCLS